VLFVLGEFIWQVTYRQTFTRDGDTKRMAIVFSRQDKGIAEAVFTGSEEIRLAVRNYTKVAERPFQVHYTRRLRGCVILHQANTVEALRRVEQFLEAFMAASLPAGRDISRWN
jgi:hypothetical protein